MASVKKFGLVSSSFAALSVGLAAPALAQNSADESADQNSPGIGMIVVTAQKRAQNIQDVPGAISAVSGEYLQARDITSISDLGTIAPNVKIERAPGSATTAQVSMRGSVTINPNVTWEPAVGIYLDGIYIAKNQGAIFDVADLERVEVLRGPQGTLYGRNTLAGAVNLITAKPTGEFGGKVEGTYGNYNYRRMSASVNLPSVGPLSVKVSGQIATRDGFYDVVADPYPAAAGFSQPPIARDVNSLDNQSFMIQARLEPTDNLTLDYMYDYTKYDQSPTNGQLIGLNLNGGPSDIFDPTSPNYTGIPLGLFVDPNRADTLSLNANISERTRTYGHALTATLDIGDLELKSISAYRNLSYRDALDLDGSPISIAHTARITSMDSFSQELQLAGAVMSDRVNFVVGGFYYTEDADTLNPQTYFGVFGPFGNQFDSRYASKAEAWAVYGQVDAELTDGLSLTLGARYTEEKKSISRFLQLITDPGIPPADLPFTVVDIGFGDVPDANYNDFSPSATLSYAFTPDNSVYARFAKGYKSGGFNGETNTFVAPTPDCPSGATELCNPYLPETVDSYELGLKNVFADGAVVLNIAGFWDNHKQIQLAVFDATGAAASTVLNAASATIRGIEVETVIRPTDTITLNGSFAFLDAKYDSYIDGGVDVSNNRAFPHVPKYTAAFGADWRAAEGNWGRLNLIGDVSYVSKYYTYPYQISATEPSSDPTAQVAGNTRSDGRLIANLRATVSRVRLASVDATISAFVRNVTDEDSPSNFIDFGQSFGGILLGYYPDPRTYGLTLGISF